jgi:1-pyrroline-4-hydroxy-2-carboxylate deaminase
MYFAGVLPAVATPFVEGDVSINREELVATIRWLVDSGAHGIVGIGTMGEFRSLNSEERLEVAKVIVEAAEGRVPVTIGVSSDTPREACEAAVQAARIGASGIMTLPPVSYHADDRELVAYFEAVSSATDLPLIVYNNPQGSKNDLDPPLISRLFEIDRLVAVKECSGDARRIAAILELTAHQMEVLVGGDDWALEGFCAGATGWVSGCANVAPVECVDLWNLCVAGKLPEARDVYFRLLPLARLDMDPKLVQFFKAAMDEVGRYGGPTRPPRLPLTETEQHRVKEAVAALTRKG